MDALHTTLTGSPKAIFLPLVGQTFLTLFALAKLAAGRVHAVSSKQVRPAYYKLHHDPKDDKAGEPLWLAQIDQYFTNSCELPTFFFPAVLALFAMGDRSATSIYLAWAFFGFRFLHACVMLGWNNVTHRFASFLLSVVALAALWVRVAIMALN